MLQIQIDDRDVRVMLEGLSARMADMRPALAAIGEDMVESVKQRFASATGPDGQPWEPNSPVTIERFLHQFYRDKKTGPRKQDGSLRADAARRTANKKPLTGETRALQTTINYQIDGPNSVRIGSPMIYAATQQYGAKQGQFKSSPPVPWGRIPARPFLGFSAHDQQSIVQTIREHLGLR